MIVLFAPHRLSLQITQTGLLQKVAKSLQVRVAHSIEADPTKAITELAAQLDTAVAGILIFFCSASYDLKCLGRELNNTFDSQLIGCTTAGEISSENGYQKNGIVAATISSSMLRTYPYLIENISSFDINKAASLSKTIRTDLQLQSLADRSMFAFLLIDGLSLAEEKTAALLYNTLDKTPLFGGSAGDDLAFEETYIYYNGQFHKDCALLTLFDTELPFHIFKTQHLIPTDKKLVITGTIPGKRRITEINGFPAAAEYARIIDKEISELTVEMFSAHPFLLKVGGEYFIRTIASANEDGSLSLYCDIDRGLVVSIAQSNNLAKNITQTLREAQEQVPNPRFILGCDCIARKLELEGDDLIAGSKSFFSDCTFLGFSTYGEQFNAIHINQTFTGVVIGAE